MLRKAKRGKGGSRPSPGSTPSPLLSYSYWLNALVWTYAGHRRWTYMRRRQHRGLAGLGRVIPLVRGISR